MNVNDRFVVKDYIWWDFEKKRYKLEIVFYIFFNGCSMWKSVFDLMLICIYRVVCYSNYIVLMYK